MNQLPAMQPLSPQEQQRRMEQLYVQMAEQVKGYHRHYHKGESSSVPLELAQELMLSLEYTAEQAGGIFARGEFKEVLALGQSILEEKWEQGKQLLRLVQATAPSWQTECRWEAMESLAQYLDRYDTRYLAHRGPENLFYPILIAPPENIRGIDQALFYLHVLWMENQIMASFSDNALTQLWDRLPPDTLNQCEQVLFNALGKVLAGQKPEPLVFSSEEYGYLLMALRVAGEDALHRAWQKLCQWMDVKEPDTAAYIQAALAPIAQWTGNAGSLGIENVFL